MIHTISKFRVRYVETDRMNVVHHKNYLVWFEAARIEMLDEIDLPYAAVEAEGFFIPVLGANIEYKKPAFFDDRIEVHLYMREKPRARFRFDYEVRRDGELLAAGHTTHGFMDGRGKALRPPEAFLAKVLEAWNEPEG
ncbi:acyl-CoA thioesterase [Coraliomargarita sinensis]|uniref:Acyl-CoA thioesterase n=1 Tax=Coraliomargarita sinensis TaxID=2174842 RepID=A0A317ZCK7_9BACT|nr:thioesterase family protein [Coraliomargarita sinensis]PXA02884.1 acyl-CoA thioesterase [Coraliomargarita sinensis]